MIGFCVGHEFVECRGRQACPHRQHLGRVPNRSQGHEILQDVVVQVLVERGVGRQGTHVAKQQRIAVGGRPSGPGLPYRAARAGHVLDHDALLDLLGQTFGQRPRKHVGGAASGERHQQRQRPAWIGIGLSRARRHRRREQ
ncbi:hypothetical protein D3C85_1445280 [compost metagenome]